MSICFLNVYGNDLSIISVCPTIRPSIIYFFFVVPLSLSAVRMALFIYDGVSILLLLALLLAMNLKVSFNKGIKNKVLLKIILSRSPIFHFLVVHHIRNNNENAA